MKKVLILHGLNCHYHIIAAFIEQLQDFEVDLLMPVEVQPKPLPHERFDAWDQICRHMNLKYNLIGKIVPNRKYDYCILDTDDDHVGCSYYNKYYDGTPILVIQVQRRKMRDTANPKYKRSLGLLCNPTPSPDFFFFGFHYLESSPEIQFS